MAGRIIPQRELRNKVGEILREAEAGTEFTITVRGRPVARLGPPDGGDRRHVDVPAGTLRTRLAETPVDDDFAADIATLRELEATAEDPLAQPVIHALLDTSIVIASGDAITLESDDTAAISVLTIGELHAGVRLASDPDVRALRQARLAAVRDAFEPVPVDETIALHYGELLAFARTERRSSKATDLLIISTASATGRTLVTLDDAQASLARIAGVAVNR